MSPHSDLPNGSTTSRGHWLHDVLMSLREDLGALKAGQRWTHQSISALDQRVTAGLNTVHGRVTEVEKQLASRSSTEAPSPAAALGTLTGLREVILAARDFIKALMPLRWIAALSLLTLLAIKGVVTPLEVKAYVREFLGLPPAPSAPPSTH